MATINYELATDIILPNITVERAYVNNELKAYRLTANAGYVMYRTDANDVTIDPDTLEEIPITYYYRQASMNVRVPIENWTWVAVPESDAPADNIFGGGDNDHETI